MSAEAVSMGRNNSWPVNTMHHHRKHREITKDQLTHIEEKMKAQGEDTSNLYTIIDSFEQLDTNQDGKLSSSEMKTGAEQYGYQWPKRPHHSEPPSEQTITKQQKTYQCSTQPSDSRSGTACSDNKNALLKQMVESFKQTDANISDEVSSSTISIAA